VAEGGDLREALKAVAVSLKRADVTFALGGSYAAWAHGAPEPEHDVDFLVAAADLDRAQAALRADGLQVEQPPEDWLVKVYRDGCLVDLIHTLQGRPIDGTELSDAEVLEVLSVRMPVLSATEVVVERLLALDEHACDLASPVATARALREQVDWGRVRERTADNDVAAATLFLLERLGVIEAGPA
jgi:hypothetical protein